MRLHRIGRASFLVEAEGCRILIDPRLGGDPDGHGRSERWLGTETLPEVDVLMISSRRPAAFDVATLAALPRDVEVLLPEDDDLAACLSALGYTRLSRCRPFEERRVGSTRLVVTPSAAANEHALLIRDPSAAVLSLADLAVDAATVDRIRDLGGPLDAVVAAWRPRAMGGSLRSPDRQLGRYGDHLAALARTGARWIVPWSDPLPAALVPGPPLLEVPVDRERFFSDLRRVAPAARPGILGTGDVLLLERGAERPEAKEPEVLGRVELQATPVVPLQGAGLEPAAATASPAADLPARSDQVATDETLDRILEAVVARFAAEITTTYAAHRAWGAVLLLEVVDDASRSRWSFDFGAEKEGEATVEVRRGTDPRADVATTIPRRDLEDLAHGRAEWHQVVARGGYGTSDACYRVVAGGAIERPRLEDPVALLFGGSQPFRAVKERQIDAERARWAARLLGTLAGAEAGGATLTPATTDGPASGRRSGAPPAIPAVVTEEHHEAFLVWHAAVRRGLLPRCGNVLLHVDQHSDMRPPRFHRPLPPVDADLDEIERFTDEELDLESFLAPACLHGLFERIEWIQREEPPVTRVFRVTSLDDQRKVLAIEERAAAGDVEGRQQAPWVTWRTRRLDGPPPAPPAGGLVLGIDLDYFSCDDALNRRATLEVTAEEIAAFARDPYHPLRLGNRFRSRVVGGRCFLDYNCFDEELRSARRASEEQIAERIQALIDFLAAHSLVPQLIHVTRSRHSGFTPAHQWQRIEEMLLGGLHSLYDLRVSSIEDLRRRRDPAPSEARQAAPPSPVQSATLPVVRDAAFPTHLDFPGGRVLLIPTGCNNRCSFCMVDEFIETFDHHGRPRGEAPLSAELRALVEEVAPGSRIDFFGAEPTLHESFFNLLGLAAERKLRITLATNGRVFSSPAYTRRVAALAPPELLQVRTSILGATADVHDRISRAPGSFDQMLRGVRNLVDERYDVHLNMVLTRENQHQAAATAEVGIDHGARSMKISGLIDLGRNAGSFVPYREAEAAVEAFCSVCERRGVPYAIEKLPLCAAPRRMHHFVYEQGVYTPDRGVLTGPGQPCRSCVVRNVCFGVEPAFVERFGVEGLRTVTELPAEVQTPLGDILAGRAAPAFYRLTFTRVGERDLEAPLEAWAELLRFKRRCEREVGDLCIERGAKAGAGAPAAAGVALAPGAAAS